MKAVSHQPSEIRHPATGIQHPLSPNHQSTIINHRGLLPLHRTFPDNSRGRFVRSVFQFFPRIKGPAACRSGQFGRQLSARIEFPISQCDATNELQRSYD